MIRKSFQIYKRSGCSKTDKIALRMLKFILLCFFTENNEIFINKLCTFLT